jgi:hypothetical protein
VASRSQYGAPKKGGRKAGFRNAKLARKFGARGSGGKGNAWRAYLKGK